MLPTMIHAHLPVFNYVMQECIELSTGAMGPLAKDFFSIHKFEK